MAMSLGRLAARRGLGAAARRARPLSGGPGGNQGGQAEEGMFSKLRKEVESNPEIKKTLDELKQSKVGGKTVEEAAEALRKGTAQTAAEAKDRLDGAAESAKESSSKAFEKGSSEAKQAGETVEEFFTELKSQFGIGGKKEAGAKAADGAGAKAAEEGSSANADAAGASDSGPSAAEEAKSSFATRLGSVRSTVLSKLPESFGNDNQSWEDAFKEVFGIKVDKKRRAAGQEEAAEAEAEAPAAAAAAGDAEEWFEATDKESGDIYYYNKAGETVWEKPTSGKIVKSPEHEAHDWAEAQHEVKPSLYEIQIAEKSAEISKLEDERDAAMADQDMAKFKEINKRVRELRKEIERISQQANTTAVVHVEEEKSAWEQFNERLMEAPIIKNVFGIADSEVARKARDAASDAREALETSQNPLVYRMYSVYDSMFAETEMGEAIREFRRMDPDFTIEGFLEEMQDDIAPAVVKAFLRGDIETIDSYCSEGAAAAVKASIKDRIAAGRRADENILSIGEMHLAAAKVVDKMGPMIVVQFMSQQINCLYNSQGEVVEGKDDEIVGVVYIFALTREYDEETTENRWTIKEFAIGGSVPYI